MHRDQARFVAPFLSAYADGATVQYRKSPLHEWENAAFAVPVGEYRIKPVEVRNIQWAAEKIAAGKAVRRKKWNNLIRVKSDMVFVTAAGALPWRPLPDDLLAEDWELFEQ
jgi:hypothetical protein